MARGYGSYFSSTFDAKYARRYHTVRLAPDPLRKSKSARTYDSSSGIIHCVINTNPILMKFERSILPEPDCWAFFLLEHWKSEWYSKF